jgi:hypothetical protein
MSAGEMTEAEATVVAAVARTMENMAKAEEWLGDLRRARDAGINELRASHNWTMVDCGDLTGLSPTTIQKIGERDGLVSVRKAERR